MMNNNTTCGCMEMEKQEKDNSNLTNYYYKVQLGSFKTFDKAMEFQLELLQTGMMSDVEKHGDSYTVNAGEYNQVDEAAVLERFLRFMGYNTLLVAIEQKDNA